MPRLMLSDEFWSKLEKILLQEAIYNKRNLRMTVEGILYIECGLAVRGEICPRRWLLIRIGNGNLFLIYQQQTYIGKFLPIVTGHFVEQ